MLETCDNVAHMAKMIQIRNVPEELHRTLKARAAHAGMTLSDYLLNEVRQVAARPTLEELIGRLRHRKPIRTRESSAEIIRRHRDAS
jgi:hypothetical protein